MMYFVSKIEDLEKKYGNDENLSKKANVSIFAQKYLIDNLKKQEINADFTIARTDKGKPYFVNQNGLLFSISHTTEYVAVGFDNTDIGIDIESLRIEKSTVAKRFFHKQENIYLDSLPEQERDAAFTQLWTIKEAFVKMTGTGIADNFNNIDLSPKEFTLNQSYTKHNAKIVSKYLEKEALFLSIVARI